MMALHPVGKAIKDSTVETQKGVPNLDHIAHQVQKLFKVKKENISVDDDQWISIRKAIIELTSEP